MDPQGEVGWGDPKEVILTPINHTKVYRSAMDDLRDCSLSLGVCRKYVTNTFW